MTQNEKEKLALAILITVCALLIVAATVWSLHTLASEIIPGVIGIMSDAIPRIGP